MHRLNADTTGYIVSKYNALVSGGLQNARKAP